MAIIALGLMILTNTVARQAMAETRIALVIGNSAYPDEPLLGPALDESRMSDTLKRIGFAVIEKQNLNRAQLIDAIRQFGDRLRMPGTMGLFYYSGHGMQVNNRNYLIPVDAFIKSERTSMWRLSHWKMCWLEWRSRKVPQTS